MMMVVVVVMVAPMVTMMMVMLGSAVTGVRHGQELARESDGGNAGDDCSENGFFHGGLFI
jgi:hypothetical protein